LVKECQVRFGVDLANPQDKKARHLLVISILKQREEDVGDRVPIFMDPGFGILDNWDESRREYKSASQ
jgi:hypothetical protein